MIANVDLTSTIKKLNQTTTFPRGQFTGSSTATHAPSSAKRRSRPATSPTQDRQPPARGCDHQDHPQGTSRTDISFDGWDWALHTPRRSACRSSASSRPACRSIWWATTASPRLHPDARRSLPHHGDRPGDVRRLWETGTLCDPEVQQLRLPHHRHHQSGHPRPRQHGERALHALTRHPSAAVAGRILAGGLRGAGDRARIRCISDRSRAPPSHPTPGARCCWSHGSSRSACS